jgi:hypothetical protein
MRNIVSQVHTFFGNKKVFKQKQIIFIKLWLYLFIRQQLFIIHFPQHIAFTDSRYQVSEYLLRALFQQ